jgi:hypothetical protein
MAKYDIVIDTNIYHKDQARSKLPFLALSRLCKAGVVQLHIPYIVEREFQTHLVAGVSGISVTISSKSFGWRER